MWAAWSSRVSRSLCTWPIIFPSGNEPKGCSSVCILATRLYFVIKWRPAYCSLWRAEQTTLEHLHKQMNRELAPGPGWGAVLLWTRGYLLNSVGLPRFWCIFNKVNIAMNRISLCFRNIAEKCRLQSVCRWACLLLRSLGENALFLLVWVWNMHSCSKGKQRGA
jgi:hypothetical protein